MAKGGRAGAMRFGAGNVRLPIVLPSHRRRYELGELATTTAASNPYDKALLPTQHFIHGRKGIPNVEVQHINKIGVEALEALLYTAHHVLAVVAAGIGVGLVVVQAVLGSHHPVVAVMLVDKRSHNFFTHTILIAVGGIQKIATGIAKGFHEIGAFIPY